MFISVCYGCETSFFRRTSSSSSFPRSYVYMDIPSSLSDFFGRKIHQHKSKFRQENKAHREREGHIERVVFFEHSAY